ncbi:MAG: hypothetical protein E6Q97_04190 [Desulfurellales bacterium]|nr:MAG: hypothetical protein E6Q97_04190 [Desulfurellales bacterium]
MSNVDELIGMLPKGDDKKTTSPVDELVAMVPQERTLFNPSSDGPYTRRFGRIAGALEQIPAGVWGLGSMLGSAISATANTGREKLRQWTDGTDPRIKGRAVYQGKTAGEIWTEEYRAASENAASMYVPLTPQGAELSRKLGTVLTEAVQWVGDKVYENGIPTPIGISVGKESPVAGALGQTIATIGTMLPLGAKRGPVRPEPVPTPVEVWQGFEKKYPETTKRIETVGAVRMGDFIASDRTLFDLIHRKLNTDLGINDTGGKIPLQSKVEMVILKDQPGIPVPEAQKAARAFVDQIAQFDAAREARANASGLPAPQPSPAISPEPVIVTKSGTAITPEQAAARDAAFIDMTPDERASVLGVSAMGRMRLLHEEIVAAEASGNTAAARKLSNQLKQEWAKTFPYRDVAKRNDSLDVFRNFGGRLTWEEASIRMGEPTNVGRARGIDRYGPLGKPKEEAPKAPMTDTQLENALFGPRKGKPGGKQAGVIDIEGLRYTLGSFNDLPSTDVLKAATITGAINRQGITQAERSLITDIMKGRETITQAELKREVAAQVLPLRAVDTMEYATYGLQNIGVNLKARWSNAANYEAAPAASQPARTTVWRMPMESDIGTKHFEDRQYFAHTRSFDRQGARHIVEIQSDLVQGMKESEPRRASIVPPEEVPAWRNALREFMDSSDPEREFTGTDLSRLSPETQAIIRRVWVPEASPFPRVDPLSLSGWLEREIHNALRPLDADDLGPVRRLGDRWTERVLLEENRRASEQGVRVMRMADAETVRKVEGWPDTQYIEVDGQQYRLYDGPSATNVWYDAKGDVVPKGSSRWFEIEKKFDDEGPQTGLDPAYRGIYRRYRDDIPKILKQQFGARYVKSVNETELAHIDKYRDAILADMVNPSDRAERMMNVVVLEGRIQKLLKDKPRQDAMTVMDIVRDLLTRNERVTNPNTIKHVNNTINSLKDAVKEQANGWWEWDVRPQDATRKIQAFGGKQRGALIVEGFDDVQKELTKVGQAAVQGAGRAWPIGSEEFEKAAAAKVQATFNETLKVQEEAVKRSFGTAAERVTRSVVGHDVTLKNALEKSGPYGEKAKARMVLQRGATDAARIEMEQINDRIFNDLKPEEKKLVDELARARRIVEIDDKKGVGAVKHEGGITGPEAEAWARQLRRTIGDTAYARINGKVNEVFKVYEDLLRDRLADGLIDEKTFDRLLHFDYKPEQFTDLIDPMLTYEIGDKRVSVRASGLQDLSGGGRAPRVLDTQMLLAEAIGRTRNQQFKNRTLNALFEMAKEQPGNGLVQIVGDGKPGGQKPLGHTRINVMVDGQKREIFMPNELAHELLTNPQPMLPWVANAINIMSGSASLRFTAVGANPVFPIAGIPMDILHTWMASSRGYSPHPPIYLAQIGRDMVSVLGDVVKKGPDYQQAMREGLGAHYSASYGQHVFTRDLTMAERVMPRYEKVLRVLRGFNQEADVLVRMAHRKRLIDQGMPSEMATAIARDRLDYAQGGELIKALDTAIPWTNVSVQALYKAARNARQNPGDFAVKATWLAGAVAGSVLANMISSPETWQSIPARDKVNSIIITFGDQFYLVDPDGNKRYLYVPLRVDQTASPILGTIVGTMEAAEYGRAPSDIVRQSVASSINLMNGVDLIPTLSAGMAMAGLDPFTGKAIADSPHARPSTSPFAKAIGDATGQSPVRLETAFGKVVATSNPWLRLAGSAAKELLFEDDPRTKEKLTEQMVIEQLRPVVKLTNPMTKFMDSVDEAVKAVTDQQVRQRDGLDEILYKVGRGQEPKSAIESYIKAQPPEDRERLVERAKHGYTIDQVMRRYEAGNAPGVPPAAWWRVLASAPARARAQEFHSKWLEASPADRKKMENIAFGMSRVGVSFASEDFKRELMREKKLLGEDQR